jgi:small subunit ribosomal protein S14
MTRLALLNKQRTQMAAYLRSKAEGKKPKFPTRIYNRCTMCGRRHGFLRFFGICRICFRENANEGLIPGVTKSSW